MSLAMKRSRRFFFAVTSLLALPILAADQDQVQGSFGSWIDLRPGGAKVEFGQTFQPGIAGRLESFEHSGVSPGSVAEYPTTFDIVDVVGGQPGTNLLGRTVITNISAQTRVYFTNQSIYLETNAAYAIVASTEAPLTTSREYYFRASLGDAYSRGRLWSRALGEPWSPADMWGNPAYPRDLVFATYMEPGIPAVRISQPSAGALVNVGASIAVAATLSPAVTNAIAVEFYADGILFGSDSEAPYARIWTPTAPGNVALHAVLHTLSGPSTTSSVCQVTATLVRPPNDDFAGRFPVAGEVVAASIDQVNATAEAGEPRPFAGSLGRSVWWEWTAPRSAWATVVVTPAPQTNALLGIYTGSQVAALYPQSAGTGAVVCWMEAAEPRQVMVDSMTDTLQGSSLQLVLNDVEITAPAPNTVYSAPATVAVSLQRLATNRELTAIEVRANGQPLGMFPPGATTRDVLLPGPGAYDLQLAATDTQGVTTFSRKVSVFVQPANDDVAAAQPVAGREVVVHTTNLGATFQALDPRWAENQGGHSLWYRWTAPADGMCLIDGRGTNFALLINVCLGTVTGGTNSGASNNVTSLSVVAANALAPPNGVVQFDAVAGTTYWISVDGFFGEAGPLDWTLLLKPYNDDFASRRVLAGIASEFADSTSGATLQSGEAAIAPLGAGASLWYGWQAPLPGLVSLQLTATNPVAVVVCTGTSLTNLVLVTQSVGWTNSPRVTFQAQAGETYQIAVFTQGSTPAAFTFQLFWQGLRFVSPSPNTIWPAPATLPLRVQLEVPGQSLQSVTLSANGSVIASLNQPPFGFDWVVPGAGTYTLSARGLGTDNLPYDSVPLTCLVYADDQLPRPRVFAGVQSAASYVLNAVGALHLFGAPANQFGRPPTNVLSTPFLAAWPAGVTGWQEISGGWAISESGVLYQNGQTLIPFPAGVTRWKHVSCGFNGMVTVGDDGELYLSGTTHIPVTRPPGGWLDARASLAYVNETILALGADHEVYLVSNANFQWSVSHLPRPLGVTGWKAIAQAALFGVLLTDADELWIYGMYGGVTGTSGTPGYSYVPRPFGVSRWVDFAAGGFHVLAIGNNAQLYAWGRNWEHQLGLGLDQNTRATPVKVEPPAGVAGWSAVAAGQFHSLAIGQDCSLYAWGENGSGQLGQPASPPLARPIRVASLEALCGTPVIFTDGAASRLPDGAFRLRFNTDLNRAYLIQYADQANLWQNANGLVLGTGEVLEWVDNGPPKTATHPSTVTSRMYRVVYGP
jgi:hypothetical protein